MGPPDLRRSVGQLVIVSIRLTVPTVVPLAFLSVIVTVVEPARFARSCQETFCDPPGPPRSR